MDIWRYAAAAGAGAARARSLLAGSPVRPLHPAGRTFTAEVEVWGGGERHWGAGLLDIAGRHEATVRVSKGAGTPDGWPDVLGLAIRVAGAGATGPFDLLLSSTGRAPGLRHLPTPRRDFTATYGSILPYHGRRGRVWLAALPAPGVTALGRTLDAVAAATPAGRARLLLAAARSPVGRWRPFGVLSLRAELPAAQDARIAFDPSRHHPADLRPAGTLQKLRGVVYRGAQRVRTAADRPASTAP